MEQRKTFNFYRSYWSVAQQLSDKDRLKFYDALMTRQFTGIETELDGMANFAYISQKHSIDAQVLGFCTKTKTELPTQPPSVGATQGATQPPSAQEKEEEKEKEENNNTPTKVDEINFDILLTYINETFGRSFKVINEATKKKYKATLKQGYTKDQIRQAIQNAKNAPFHIENNYQYCTVEYFSRPKTIDMYSQVTEAKKSFEPMKIIYD